MPITGDIQSEIDKLTHWIRWREAHVVRSVRFEKFKISNPAGMTMVMETDIPLAEQLAEARKALNILTVRKLLSICR